MKSPLRLRNRLLLLLKRLLLLLHPLLLQLLLPAMHLLLRLLPATLLLLLLLLPQQTEPKCSTKKPALRRLFCLGDLPPAETLLLAGNAYPFLAAVHGPAQGASGESRGVVLLAEMGCDDMLQTALVQS